MTIVVIVVIVAAVLAFAGIKLLPAEERGVVYRLGRIVPAVRGPGLLFVIPSIDRLVRVSIGTQAVTLSGVAVTTSDRASVHVDASVGFRIVDPVRALSETADYRGAVAALAERAFVVAASEMTLSELLVEHAAVSRRVQSQLEMQARVWGVKITEVVVGRVDVPDQNVRDLQERGDTDRRRRERILENESGD